MEELAHLNLETVTFGYTKAVS